MVNFFKRIFGAEEPDCSCDELMPRWRGPDVMDDEHKAMGFICHRCGREYLPYQVEGRRLVRRK